MIMLSGGRVGPLHVLATDHHHALTSARCHVGHAAGDGRTLSVLGLLLGYFQTAWPLKRKPVPCRRLARLADCRRLHPHLQRAAVGRKADHLRGARARLPADKLAIHVLDDGRRREFKAFCEDVGVTGRSATAQRHAKAGNINHALKITQRKYLAIFDCDHVPTRCFLQMTVGWFLRDQLLAMLQTPHYFYSPDPFERNLGTFARCPTRASCSMAWCRTATICGTRRSSAARARCCGARRSRRSAASPSKRSPKTRIRR